MTLYEIDQELRQLLEAVQTDEETGEILDGFDPEKVEELNIMRDKKLEGVALFIKELSYEEEALKAEAKKLTERAKSQHNKSQSLVNYLSMSLLNNNQTKYETNKVALSFKNSEIVEADETLVPKKYFKKKIELALDKAGIKKLLKAGEKIRGCQLIEKQNLQIK